MWFWLLRLVLKTLSSISQIQMSSCCSILPHQGGNFIQPLTLISAMDMYMMAEISEDDAALAPQIKDSCRPTVFLCWKTVHTSSYDLHYFEWAPEKHAWRLLSDRMWYHKLLLLPRKEEAIHDGEQKAAQYQDLATLGVEPTLSQNDKTVAIKFVGEMFGKKMRFF